MCQKIGIYPESNEEFKHELYFWHYSLYPDCILQVFNTAYLNWRNWLSSNKKRRFHKFKSFRLLNPNYLACTSLGSKSDIWAIISLSSLLLHALYFSHSQILAIPSRMIFAPEYIVHGLPSHSLSSRFNPFIKRKLKCTFFANSLSLPSLVIKIYHFFWIIIITSNLNYWNRLLSV